MEIVIAGGGIVGLTTALSLAAAGFRPTVFESAHRYAPLGVGINLLPQAMRELTELGLGDAVRSIGVPIGELSYLMQDGRPVWSEPRGLAAGYGWPQVAVHRGRFQMFLLERVRAALGEDAVRTGMALTGFEARDGGVAVAFTDRRDGRQVAVGADVLIGADGIHSTVRRAFYPDEGRPLWNGVSLFRSTTLLPPGAFGPRMLWCGHADQKFIAYPIAVEPSGEVLLNWVCDLRTATPGTPADENWNREADPSLLLERFADWRWAGLDVPAIVAANRTVYEFPMVDRDPLPRWSFGRVTLAGDAAHAMYPIGSNGATQGIIDARALAYCLATVADPVAALARYEDLRREATTRIVLGNRAQGPDVVLELARQRAPDASVDLATVLSVAERSEIAGAYKRLAGFDPATLAARRSFTVPSR